MNPKKFFLMITLSLTILTAACTNPKNDANLAPTDMPQIAPETIESPLSEPTVNPQSTGEMLDNEQILNATIQINLCHTDSAAAQLVCKNGLGTLVEANGELLLVTHDHWTDLPGADKVILSDADGELLAELNGENFASLIRFHDGGTTIMQAPAQLSPEMQALLASRGKIGNPRKLVPVQMNAVTSPQVGQTLQVAYRTGSERTKVSVLYVVVESVVDRNGVAAINLKSLDGTPIQPGDSGGGIWQNGTLIGNMWATYMVENTGSIASGTNGQAPGQYLNTSTAALLPELGF